MVQSYTIHHIKYKLKPCPIFIFQALGVRKMNFIWVCYQPGSSAFYCDLFIFLYLGILQIVGLIFAFQTRKVKIPILNDSKYVTALVYISSVVFVSLVLVTFLLQAYINISNGIFSGGIMLLATIFLILMFVPKVQLKNQYMSIQFMCTSSYGYFSQLLFCSHAQRVSVICRKAQKQSSLTRSNSLFYTVQIKLSCMH